MTYRDDELAAQLERDTNDPTAWENDDDESVPERGLGATITVRLDADTARGLRERAAAAGVGYTTLLRTWVQERLSLEEERAYHLVVWPTAMYAGSSFGGQSFSFKTGQGSDASLKSVM